MKLILTLLLLASGAYAQVIVPGNPTCKDLGFNSEFKIEPPRAGTFNVVGVGTITTTINSPQTLSWTSSSPAFVKAVIMKAGPQANVYHYNPAVLGGDLLNTGSQSALSHVSFCYNLAPTAAHVNISGQVLDFYGRPVSKAIVIVTDARTGEVKQSTSNPFGYYSVTDLEVGNFYQITVKAKGKEFLPVFVSLVDELVGFNLVALY